MSVQYPTTWSSIHGPQPICSSRRSLAWALGLYATASVACGGQDDSASVSADQQAYIEACSESCLGKTATGCALVDRETCERGCGAVAANTSEECLPLQAALVRCESAAGYACDELRSASVADREACRAEADAAEASCTVECTGTNADGVCPTVQCACPSGPSMISGFTNERGDCRCLTQQTCLEGC